ncbi:MAG: hypothetical protein ACUVX9_08435 [Anaerolineae bacterium]
MAQELRKSLAHIAADEVPDGNVDLWPGIRGRVHGQQATARAGMLRMAAVCLVAGALVVSVALAAPSVRAVARDVVQRFGLAFRGSEPHAPVVLVEATVTPGEAAPAPSVQDLRQQVGFPLRVPTWLPAGLVLANGSAQDLGETQKVILEYRRTTEVGTDAPVLRQWVATGPMPAPPLLAAKYEQPSSVAGLPAIYTHGGWREDGRGDPETAVGPLRWDDTLDAAYLTWEEDGLTYLLEAQGLGLSEAELVRIAESLR